MLHRGSHVAEVTRAADQQAITVFQLGLAGIGQAAFGNRILDLFGLCGNIGQAAQHRLGIRVGFDTQADLLGHARHAAMAAVINDQDLSQ